MPLRYSKTMDSSSTLTKENQERFSPSEELAVLLCGSSSSSLATLELSSSAATAHLSGFILGLRTSISAQSLQLTTGSLKKSATDWARQKQPFRRSAAQFLPIVIFLFDCACRCFKPYSPEQTLLWLGSVGPAFACSHFPFAASCGVYGTQGAMTTSRRAQ